MSLSSSDRARYARHLLLSQLGEAGQERLLAARVGVRADVPPDVGVLQVARAYLSRAGVQLGSHDDASHIVSLPSARDVATTATIPELEPAARALLGALAAVRAVQDIAELPSRAPQTLPFAISSEEA